MFINNSPSKIEENFFDIKIGRVDKEIFQMLFSLYLPPSLLLFPDNPSYNVLLITTIESPSPQNGGGDTEDKGKHDSHCDSPLKTPFGKTCLVKNLAGY